MTYEEKEERVYGLQTQIRDIDDLLGEGIEFDSSSNFKSCLDAAIMGMRAVLDVIEALRQQVDQ